MVAEERNVKLGASLLEDKSQVAVAAAFEKLAPQLADAKTAMNMRLAETVDQITKREQALDPFGLWQVTEAADNCGIDGEKLIQAAFGALAQA